MKDTTAPEMEPLAFHPGVLVTNARRLHELHPASFQVPDAGALARIGHDIPMVKIGLQLADSDQPGERLWVRVDGPADSVGQLTGRLANDPITSLGARFEWGTPITFNLRHIMATDTDSEDTQA